LSDEEKEKLMNNKLKEIEKLNEIKKEVDTEISTFIK
jgi:hypothetical protein